MSAAHNRRRTISDPATPRRHQPSLGDSDDEYQANQCPPMKRPASPDEVVERSARRQGWTYTRDHGNKRHPVGCNICNEFESHCDAVRTNESRAYNRARDDERDEIGRSAYDRGYDHGWRDCERVGQDQASSDQEELQRLRTKVQLLHEENARQAAQLQREQREERERVRSAAVHDEATHDNHLRQRALESRLSPGGPSRTPEIRDVDMYDGTAASIHAPQYEPPAPQGQWVAGPSRGPAVARPQSRPESRASSVYQPGEQRNARYDRGNSGDKPYRQGSGPVGQHPAHSSRHSFSPPARSVQGGRATGQYNQKQKFRQRDTRRPMQPSEAVIEQERVLFRFDDIPQTIEEVRNVVRQAECEHCHLAVWKNKQWREDAQRKEPRTRTAAENWLLENWTTPMWYKHERKDIWQNGKAYRGNTPPTYQHPVEHWFSYLATHRDAVRKGIRRLPDGKPDLRVLEGFLMTLLIARPDEEQRANNRTLIFNCLAGLCVDPAVYAAEVARLGLEPLDELSLKPYSGQYPPTAESICQHMSFCGIRPWDIQASLQAWAHEWLQATERAPAYVAAAQPADEPTLSTAEDEAPNVDASGTALPSVEDGNTHAADNGSSMSSRLEDVDMGVESLSASATVTSV